MAIHNDHMEIVQRSLEFRRSICCKVYCSFICFLNITSFIPLYVQKHEFISFAKVQFSRLKLGIPILIKKWEFLLCVTNQFNAFLGVMIASAPYYVDVPEILVILDEGIGEMLFLENSKADLQI